MKKVLASIGIGNASVDTVLEADTVRPGDTVGARVEIDGGDAEQEVGRIELELETRYRTDDGYRETDIARYTLTDGFTIEVGKSRSVPTEIEIPYETPLTLGRTDVWVETELDIAMAVDPEDRDALTVEPTPRLSALFDAAEALGLSLHTAECEADSYGRYFGSSFVQEFEFRPQGGPFADELDELDVVARDGPDSLTAFVEVDRRGGLLSELADADESRTRFTVESTDVDAVADELRDAIRQRV
ncbi:sporulation protein [Halobaculum gomorrense]|uniref:sporulation protein n=1 Tax=Halobaculum gomorrense TaxID=43928 RepID=UPI000933A799